MPIDQKRFTKLDSANAFERVSAHIEELILSGELKPGERLPPERDLAEAFGVSRPVIRQALVILQERGLVDVSWGRGTYITQANADVFIRSFQLLSKRMLASEYEIFELRRFLEVPVAGLAALHRTEESLSVLRESLATMKANLSDTLNAYDSMGAEFVQHPATRRHVELDIEFHITLAEMSGNRLVPLILEAYVDSLTEYMMKLLGAGQGHIQAVQQHQKILDAVASSDVRRAEQAMSEHLNLPRRK